MAKTKDKGGGAAAKPKGKKDKGKKGKGEGDAPAVADPSRPRLMDKVTGLVLVLFVVSVAIERL